MNEILDEIYRMLQRFYMDKHTVTKAKDATITKSVYTLPYFKNGAEADVTIEKGFVKFTIKIPEGKIHYE